MLIVGVLIFIGISININAIPGRISNVNINMYNDNNINILRNYSTTILLSPAYSLYYGQVI
jgi:hypothetical protein